ncbi:SubName: Full=Uncharacterized protein {ECO:0000313/EMBL:CCA66906.1} [Serendipita indica DSM 11827]|nr:SubName: Full=Uncharacterized protein {ECO:0000313/EMBL:CCA66906.1} [Serendipita indica DSM 11827]
MFPFQPLTTPTSNAPTVKFHLIDTPEDLCHDPQCPWDSVMVKYFKLKSVPIPIKHKYNVNAQEFVPASRRPVMLTEPITRVQSVPLPTPNPRTSGIFEIPGPKPTPAPYENKFTVLYSTSEFGQSLKPSRPSSKAPSEAATGSGTDYAPSNQSPEKFLLELAEQQQKLSALYDMEATAAKDVKAWHLATSTFNEALLELAPSVLERAKRHLAEAAIQRITTHESGMLEQSRRIVKEVASIKSELAGNFHQAECQLMGARLDNISNALAKVEKELIARAMSEAAARNRKAVDPYLAFATLQEQARLLQLEDMELRRQTQELASMMPPY